MSVEFIITIGIAILFGITTIVQTWRIQKYTKKNKISKSIKFYYEIKKSLSLNDVPFDLTFQHHSNAYKNIFFIEGIIGNNGNVVLSKDDLLKPLILNANEEIEMLENEIIDKTKDDLDCELIKEVHNKNILSVIINNFEPKDAFKFRMLIASNEDKLSLQLNGLIKDENISIKPQSIEIDKIDYRMALERNESGLDESGCGFIVLLLFGAIVGLYFLFLWFQSLIFLWLRDNLKFTISSSEILSFIIGIAICAGLVTLIILLIKKITIRRKSNKKVKDPTLTGFGPWFDLRIRTKNIFDHLD